MPLWYVGAGPSNFNDVATNDYTKSLVSRNLSQASVDSSVNAAFSPYALTTYLTSKRDNASPSIAIASQSFVDSGNANKILFSTIIDPVSKLPTARPGDATTQAYRYDDAVGASQVALSPVILDSSGKVPKSRISVSSTQRWLQGYWSPSSYGSSGSFTTESNLCSYSVNPSLSGNYRVIVTGSISAKSGADGQYPIIQVRVGSSALTGTIVAKGYGSAESHKGGQLTAIAGAATNQTYSIPSWCNRIDVVAIGGGGGGVNGGGLNFNGGGGGAGLWAPTTLIRGTTLPIGTTTLTYTIGAGANNANHNAFGASGSPGGTTTCSGAGMTTLSAPGGATGEKQGSTMQGESPGNYAYGGLTYIGGLAAGSNTATDPSVAGNSPGGGGQGGHGGLLSGVAGARGADGAIFFYAYLNDDVNYGQITVAPDPASANTTFTGSNTVWVNVISSGASPITTSSFNPQISVMVVPA